MDIVKLVGELATPAVLEPIARLLGVAPGVAEKGLGAAVPGVLAGLLGAAKRPGATDDLLGSALSGAGGLGDLLASDPAAAATRGSDLLSSLLGNDGAGALAGALGAYAGLPRAGAGSLLGLAGAMALGALGKEASSKGLDAAGVLGLLDRNKAAVTGALPADFAKALDATGLLAGPTPRPAATAQPRPGAPKLEPIPPARKSPWTRWLLWLVVLLLLAWLLMRLFAPAPEPVVETAPPAETTTAAPAAPEPAPAPAPTTEPAAPAPSDTAAAAANPLVVGGVDIGSSVSAALASITATFDGITDAASAQAALPRLTEARDALNGIETAVSSLPEAGHTALQQMVNAALPAIRTAAEWLKTDGPISAIVGPVIDDVLAKLTAFAA